MKKHLLTLLLVCSATSVLVTSCRKPGSVWDDNHTVGSYQPDRSLWTEEEGGSSGLAGPDEESFIALNDEDLKAKFADGAIPQPRHSPGDPGSGIPSLASFHAPQADEAKVFSNVYFNTDDHILRGKEYLMMLDKVAGYMKSHPKLQLSISGHADERGPQAYNLALGSRRANYIRSKLVEKGVNPDRIHTISYGKEKPVSLDHNAEAWSKNRRAEFKLFEKS